MTQGKELRKRISYLLSPTGLVLTGFSFEESTEKIYMSIQRQNSNDEATPSASIIRKLQDAAGPDISLIINGKHEAPIPQSDH